MIIAHFRTIHNSYKCSFCGQSHLRKWSFHSYHYVYTVQVKSSARISNSSVELNGARDEAHSKKRFYRYNNNDIASICRKFIVHRVLGTYFNCYCKQEILLQIKFRFKNLVPYNRSPLFYYS